MTPIWLSRPRSVPSKTANVRRTRVSRMVGISIYKIGSELPKLCGPKPVTMRKSALIAFTLARARPIALAILILCFALGASGQVRGLIQDSAGAPVAGAQVVAHNTAGNSGDNLDQQFMSAADGSFTPV